MPDSKVDLRGRVAESLCHPLDMVLRDALLLTLDKLGKPSLVVLCADWGITMPSSAMTVARVRLYRKMENSVTVLASLISSEWSSPSSAMTWVSKTRRFLAGSAPLALGELSLPKMKVVLDERKLASCASQSLLQALPSDSFLPPPSPLPPNSAAHFILHKFKCSAAYLKVWTHLYTKGRISLPDRGFLALVAARTGNFMTAPRLARMGKLPVI